MSSGRNARFMKPENWTIYTAKLKHQAITYSSPATIVPMVVNAHSLSDEERLVLTNEGHAFDDEGYHISQLNPFFCELTSVYWAINNSTESYIGNAHYRRKWKDADIENSEGDVLYVSDPAYFSCTLAEQFLGGHGGFDAPAMTIGLAERGMLPFSPSEMRAVWNQKVFHGCEMARGPASHYKAFMNLLFDCLWPFWCEHRDEIEAMDGYNRRMMGFVGERMMTGLILMREKFFDFNIMTSVVEYKP